MVKFITWIKDYQVMTIFVITFAITWGLGFSYGAGHETEPAPVVPTGFWLMVKTFLASI